MIYIFLNVGIALALMEGNMFSVLGTILGFYSNVAVAWIGAIVADLVINKAMSSLICGILDRVTNQGDGGVHEF
ncbi:hypothetical protein [Acidithiobacillus ferrivorans]|uniref:hypothetical protein n=1 Tax=Acidithiobacillus ferrivorans TaxID=160808 RepID=UPI0011478935|nr:hypothetical protein [Acidithiobacillus ferrivorans]